MANPFFKIQGNHYFVAIMSGPPALGFTEQLFFVKFGTDSGYTPVNQFGMIVKTVLPYYTIGQMELLQIMGIVKRINV